VKDLFVVLSMSSSGVPERAAFCLNGCVHGYRFSLRNQVNGLKRWKNWVIRKNVNWDVIVSETARGLEVAVWSDVKKYQLVLAKPHANLGLYSQTKPGPDMIQVSEVTWYSEGGLKVHPEGRNIAWELIFGLLDDCRKDTEESVGVQEPQRSLFENVRQAASAGVVTTFYVLTSSQMSRYRIDNSIPVTRSFGTSTRSAVTQTHSPDLAPSSEEFGLEVAQEPQRSLFEDVRRAASAGAGTAFYMFATSQLSRYRIGNSIPVTRSVGIRSVGTQTHDPGAATRKIVWGSAVTPGFESGSVNNAGFESGSVKNAGFEWGSAVIPFKETKSTMNATNTSRDGSYGPSSGT